MRMFLIVSSYEPRGADEAKPRAAPVHNEHRRSALFSDRCHGGHTGGPRGRRGCTKGRFEHFVCGVSTSCVSYIRDTHSCVYLLPGYAMNMVDCFRCLKMVLICCWLAGGNDASVLTKAAA